MTQQLIINVAMLGLPNANAALTADLDSRVNPLGYTQTNSGSDFAFYQAEFILGFDPVSVFGTFAAQLQAAITATSYTDEVLLTRNAYSVIFN